MRLSESIGVQSNGTPVSLWTNVSISVSDNVNRSCLVLVSKLGGRFKRNDPIDDLDAISILPFTCRYDLIVESWPIPGINTRISDLFNKEFEIFLQLRSFIKDLKSY